jgi:hypothetical protein
MLKAAAVSLALVLSLPAIAQQPAEPAPSTAPAADDTASPLPADAVPKLNIRWDCGGCKVNDKVIPLLVEDYRLEAAKHKKTVSDTHSVEARIHDFRQRNPGNRVMFGVMAGKDRLGLTLSYNDRELRVSDYSANAFEGMNALCESVAKKAYAAIAGPAKTKKKT